MFNFEIIIRPRTRFESQKPDQYRIPDINISGIKVMSADPRFPTPWMNRDYVKYWVGRFVDTDSEIDVEGVMVVKIKGFPEYPEIIPSKNRGVNRISLTKIRRSKLYGANNQNAADGRQYHRKAEPRHPGSHQPDNGERKRIPQKA